MLNEKNLNRSGNTSFSRRKFLVGTAATASLFTILPRSALGGRGYVPPSDRLNLAVVGTGGQGITNIRNLFKQPDVQIVAIADPNEESDYSAFYYGGTAGRNPALALIRSHNEKSGVGTCTPYLDFRKMLEQEKGIDAVVRVGPLKFGLRHNFDSRKSRLTVTAGQSVDGSKSPVE